MPEKTSSARPSRSPDSGPATRADDGDGERALVCNVAFCPICMAVTAAQSAAPDALEHLLKAAREFFLAARAVMDARGDHLVGEGGPRATRFEKIEIA